MTFYSEATSPDVTSSPGLLVASSKYNLEAYASPILSGRITCAGDYTVSSGKYILDFFLFVRINSTGTAIDSWTARQSILVENGASPIMSFILYQNKLYVHLKVPTPSFAYYKGSLSVASNDDGNHWNFPMSWEAIYTENENIFTNDNTFVRNGPHANGGCDKIMVGSAGTEANTLYFV
jgi:hypothetical protein